MIRLTESITKATIQNIPVIKNLRGSNKKKEICIQFILEKSDTNKFYYFKRLLAQARRTILSRKKDSWVNCVSNITLKQHLRRFGGEFAL